jgi:hypothetical protein
VPDVWIVGHCEITDSFQLLNSALLGHRGSYVRRDDPTGNDPRDEMGIANVSLEITPVGATTFWFKTGVVWSDASNASDPGGWGFAGGARHAVYDRLGVAVRAEYLMGGFLDGTVQEAYV